MINKIIEQQLQKLKVATIKSYDDLKHTYVFGKHEANKFKVGNCYLLRLDTKLLTPYNNDILCSNWNGGRYPMHKFVKVQVTKIVGKMLYTSGVYCDDFTREPIGEFWTGWLPDDQVEVLEVI